MQPIARQQTRTSLHSWWSDSNPGLQGPTINIHTMAKPLVRFLYHRQAVQFIRSNAGVPLTPAVLEIYSTYLLCKYVSFETQWTVLAELGNRAQEENEAAMIVESSVLAKALQLLESPNTDIRNESCRLVVNLTVYEATASRILEINPYARLVSLLDDKHPDVVEYALQALANASFWLDGAQAVVQATVQDQVLKLLKSPNPVVQQSTCRLVQNLGRYEATAATILKINPFVQLVLLLHNEHPGVAGYALQALANTTLWLDGAQAVVQATAQDQVLKLLESPNSVVREWTCRLVQDLAQREATAATILKINPCVHLVSLLHDEHSGVAESALEALAIVAFWQDGAQAVVQATAQDHVLKLLELPNSVVQEWTCRLVQNLGRHEATAATILKINPFVQLVSLLHNEHPGVAESALGALAIAAFWQDGAQAVIEAKVQDYILEMLESPNPVMREWTCKLVTNLSGYEATAVPIWKINPCVQIVSLLQ
ncbi:armadillo-type protein [Mycena capillaripes]|nr:armadillo-type protein [Mycena capillaripes]